MFTFFLYRYWADFDTDYFAAGISYRYAFRGTIHGDGPRDGTLCVSKVFKRRYAKYFDKTFRPDHAASMKAQQYAETFTENVLPSLQNMISTSKIEFVIPLIAKIDSLSHFKVLGLFPVNEDTTYLAPTEYVAIEPFLHGKYEKFNSNSGYEDTTATLMNAFSHWTWEASGYRYLVCDIQGVENGSKYTLTDPCIHSVGRKYGGTDLGVIGMEKFFEGHDCNVMCETLDLENPMRDVEPCDVRSRNTTYNFQLDDRELYRARQGRSRYIVPEDPIF